MSRSHLRAFSVLLAGLLAALPMAAQTPPRALLVLPRLDATSATDSFFYFALDGGTGYEVDRVRRNALEVRQSRLGRNLFELIGRPTSQAAVPGELLLAPLHSADDSVREALLVETSTGYVAYFEQLGKGGNLGEIKTPAGRPFESLRAAGGNFALLARRLGSGRTVAVTLYRATDGRALTLLGVDELPIQPEVRSADGLPALDGRVLAVDLQGGGGRTLGHLVIDQGSGAIYHVTLAGDGSIAASRRRPQNLFDVFPREAARPVAERFLAVPVQIAGQVTRHVLLIDAASGRLAWLADVDGALAEPSLEALERDLNDSLPGDGPRALAAVPRQVGDGVTSGAWVLDGVSGRTLYLGNLALPQGLTINRVTVIR
ncbi:MAG: hypothetical protein D6696_16720 [Acidobacteria bacterium]|nr:MAG: hypothetical protein D6696_16720 [Acidobacteriota bacterium]